MSEDVTQLSGKRPHHHHIPPGGDVTSGVASDAHSAFLLFLGELVGVMILAYVADAFPDFGTAIILLFVGLWVLWIVNNSDQVARWADMVGLGGN